MMQPSPGTVVLIASCSFFADMVCAGYASSNVNPSSTVRQAQLTATGPVVVTVSPAQNGLAGAGPGIIRPQAAQTALLNLISVQ